MQEAPTKTLDLIWRERAFQGAYPRLFLPDFSRPLGVYVLWTASEKTLVKPIAYVGQCVDSNRGIFGRLRDHLNQKSRQEKALWQHLRPRLKIGQALHYSMAEVDPEFADGVEKFLAGHLNPAVTIERPEVYPIPVQPPPFDLNWGKFDRF